MRLIPVLTLVAMLSAPGVRSQEVGAAPGAAQGPISASELAGYRLTAPAFNQFAEASHLIANVTRGNPRFTFAPLFTKEVALSGDAAAMAAGLVARLENDTDLAAALGAAKLTPREYTTLALVLIGAHLAHGFVDAGVLRRVPPGAPAANVEFVDAHEAEVTAILETIGVGD